MGVQFAVESVSSLAWNGCPGWRGKCINGGGLLFIAQGMTRGQGKTEGYHERRVPISAKMRGLLQTNQRESLAQLSAQRIVIIGEVRSFLWLALAVLFSNGKSGDSSDGTIAKASRFSAPFENGEDSRFFDDIDKEIEATDPEAIRLHWMLNLVDRAKTILKMAFDAGPRNSIQKYRAQSAALSRFDSGLRSDKSPLANHYRQQILKRQEESLDHA
jgi:CRISPR system Cascade subunit CasA